MPEQPWPQPLKTELLPGVAVNVTVNPVSNKALHVPGQLIPVGVLTTVPDPVPVKLTLTRFCGVGKPNVALNTRTPGWFTVNVQTGLMLQPWELASPPQLRKREPLAGVAVTVIVVPTGKVSVHVPGQAMPAGLELTVPLPVP